MKEGHVLFLALTSAFRIGPPEQGTEDNGGTGDGRRAAQGCLQVFREQLFISGGDCQRDGSCHDDTEGEMGTF